MKPFLNQGGRCRTQSTGFLRSFSVVLFLLPLLFAHTAYGDINAELIEAAQAGNTAKVEQMLRRGADVTAEGRYGQTVLMGAAAFGQTETLKVLIAAGADVNVETEDGATALMLAATFRHTETVKALIAVGADVNATHKNGVTALMEAAAFGHTKIMEILIDADADVNVETEDGATALMFTAQRGQTEIVKALIKAEADVNVKRKDGQTALIVAAAFRHTETVKALIAAGADVNAKPKKGRTALTRAEWSCHIGIMNVLKQAGAKRQRPPIPRTGPLWQNCSTKALIDAGADVNALSQSPLKTTPHDAAAVPPAEDEGDPTITLENVSEPRNVDSSSDPDRESTIAAQQQLLEDFQLYKNLLANNMIAEADTVAKRIVELSIRENGFESADTASALTNLAIVQHRNKDYEKAQQNYEAAIGIIEQVEDRLNSALINPMRGLGAAQLASGRPDQALDTFSRARQLSHVNEGPHNLDQVRILESLAEIYIYIGEFDDVNDLLDRVYALYARKYDVDSEDIIPVLYKRAEWQHRLRLYGRERETYRRIIKLVERNQDKKSLALIRPLTGLANAYLYVGRSDREYHRDSRLTTGEIYLRRAKRIAEENPDSTWEIRENTLLSLADFYIFSSQAGSARRAYQDAWDLLSEDESRFINRYNHLETTVLLQDIHPPKYYGIDDDSGTLEDDEQFEQSKVVTKFMVNTRGRAENFEIIEIHPAGFEDMEKAVQKEMRRLIYRPRLEDREVVETENMTYTHEFFYRQSDLPPVDEPAGPDSPTMDDAE